MSDLGNAVGRIRIDTSSVRAAQQEVQSASRQMGQSLQSLGGAFGIAFGAAAVAQVSRFAVQADAVATAYRRQSVAARNLAGSQAQLNDLLRVYDQTTGGAIDKATALSDVTRLLAVGFADTTEELQEFVTAARGISIATGQQQDYVISQLQLAIANQSTLRLDQLGLGVAEVQQRIEELRASNSSLTKEMAYQQAILELANQKFGALTRSAEGQATGVEKLRKAWADFRLEVGQDTGGGLNMIFEQWASDINRAESELQTFSKWMDDIAQAGARWRASMGFTPDVGAFNAPGIRSGGSLVSSFRSGGSLGGVTVGGRTFSDDQEAAMLAWAQQVQEIERQAARDRLDATQQYEQQRTSIIRDYGKTIARDAEDFARQRARAEEDQAIALQRIWRDIAQREARQLADLERTIADARIDAAERAAERQAEYEERVAETRANANARIAEMEADYNRQRERAARDQADRLRDAASRLDAVAVREAQRTFTRQQRDAQEDFDERVTKERQNEAKRLADLEKAHAAQNAAEAAALQKRIDDANAAYVRQLEDARAADAQRLEDMAADFELRKAREDEDRATRLTRMAEDFQDQLDELDRQQGLRLAQIHTQEQEARDAVNLEFQTRLAELGIQTDAWITHVETLTNTAISEFNRWWDNLQGALGIRPGSHPSEADPYASLPLPGGAVAPYSTSTTTNTSRSLTLSPTIIIQEAARVGQTREEVLAALAEFLEAYN